MIQIIFSFKPVTSKYEPYIQMVYSSLFAQTVKSLFRLDGCAGCYESLQFLAMVYFAKQANVTCCPNVQQYQQLHPTTAADYEKYRFNYVHSLSYRYIATYFYQVAYII